MSATAQAVHRSGTEKATGSILTWASFVIMAGISIPHQTIFLRTWEPAATGIADFLIWVVCILFASVVDGFTIMVTRSLLIRRKRRAKLLAEQIKPKWYEHDIKLKLGLMGSIVFSFLLNWWYSQSQAGAATTALGSTLMDASTLFIPNKVFMPLVCSCGPLLIFLLPEIADAMRDQDVLEDEGFQAVSAEEHEKRLNAIAQKRELELALKSGNQSLFEQAKERVGLPQKKDHTQQVSALAKSAAEWLLNKPEMWLPENKKTAIKYLKALLKVSEMDAELALVDALKIVEVQEEIPAQPGTPKDENQTTPIAGQNGPSDMMDKLQMTLELLGSKPDITDEELAEELELKRPASARFWRLKAVEILNTKNQRVVHGSSAAPGEDHSYDTGKREAINGAQSQHKTGQTYVVKDVSSDIVNDVVKRYSLIVPWLSASKDSVPRAELAAISGGSHQMVTGAIQIKALSPTPRNKKLMSMKSVILWLNGLPKPTTNQNQTTQGQVVNTEPVTEQNMEAIGAR